MPLGMRDILAVDRRAQMTTRTVTIMVTNIELVNQVAFGLSAFASTVSCSAANKYVGSIGRSLFSDRDTPPATRRIRQVNRRAGGCELKFLFHGPSSRCIFKNQLKTQRLRSK